MFTIRFLHLLVVVTITLLVSGCASSTTIPSAPTPTPVTEDQLVSKVIDVLIGLIGAGLGGLVTYLWKSRRTSDKELFLVLRGTFDRPAFKGPYLWHTDHTAFQEAIATTLKAVKTGRRMDSHGQDDLRVEGRYYGPFTVHDAQRRRVLQDVEDRLQRVFQLSHDFAKLGSEDTRKQIDDDRDETIRMLNLIWKDLGIPEMRIPTKVNLYEEVYDLRT